MRNVLIWTWKAYPAWFSALHLQQDGWRCYVVKAIIKVYVFMQRLRYRQDVKQGQYLSRVKLISIQRFPSPRLVTQPTLKN